MPDDRYALRGGRSGFERLQVLARERGPDTERWLEHAGVGPGMSGVDLGCGGGAVTVELARRIGPRGRVVGLDRDEEVLSFARESARALGLSNVEFRAGALKDWDEPGSHDFVYSRFVLHHLSEPQAVLRRMWAAVRPGGVLVVEDADHEDWAIHPPNTGFDFFRSTLSEVIRRTGGDPTFGRKLYRSCVEIGVSEPELRLVVPLRIREEGKQMPSRTLESISPSILEQGIASPAEVDRAQRELQRATDDPNTLVCGPRIFQLLAHKRGAVAE